MLKLKTGSDTLTRDPTRPDQAKIADPVTRDPDTLRSISDTHTHTHTHTRTHTHTHTLTLAYKL